MPRGRGRKPPALWVAEAGVALFAESLPRCHPIVTRSLDASRVMAVEAHLYLHEVKLAPGEEWSFPGDGWRFLGLQQGQAYWLDAEPRALDAGDGLMLSPTGSGHLRASQLTPVSFFYLIFQPQRLTDLLSPVERHYLESPDTQSRLRIRFLPASDPLAIQFHGLMGKMSAQNSLASRSAMLQWIASATGVESSLPGSRPAKLPNAKERFHELLAQMTENDFINAGVEFLAQRCRCSTRHFSRLFHDSFGISFSARQTELRMQKAVQLLRDTDLKVALIAGECGYRHLGLFNSTFKRRWKQTPTEWRGRERSARRISEASPKPAAAVWQEAPRLAGGAAPS